MYTRGACFQPHAVAAALFHDLRLLQLQLVNARHHDAIAGLPYILQRLGHLVVLRFYRRQPGQKAHEVSIIRYLKARLFRQRPVKQFTRQQKRCGGHSGSQVDGGDLCLTDVGTAAKGGNDPLYLPDMAQVSGALTDRFVQFRLNGMIVRQSVYPGRQEQVQLLHGKFVQNRF